MLCEEIVRMVMKINVEESKVRGRLIKRWLDVVNSEIIISVDNV